MLLVAIIFSSIPGCISPWPHWVTAPSPLNASGNALFQQNGPDRSIGLSLFLDFKQGFYFVPFPSPPPYWFLTPTGVTSTGLLTLNVLSSVRYTLRILPGQNQVSTDEWGAHKLIF